MYTTLSERTKPLLVEREMKYCLSDNLQKCHIIKEKYWYIIRNSLLFSVIILFIILFYFCNKPDKITNDMVNLREEKRINILNKIHKYQDDIRKHTNNNITSLPKWESGVI